MTEKQEITFDCKICNDDFDDETPDLIPRILKCGHTICDKCANQMLIKSKIICPFDRKVTALVGVALSHSTVPNRSPLTEKLQSRKNRSNCRNVLNTPTILQTSGVKSLTVKLSIKGCVTLVYWPKESTNQFEQLLLDSNVTPSKMTEKQEIVSTFDCKICNNDFDDETPDLIPRILTYCGHTICEKCANQMLSQSKIICPFDRKVTVLAGGDASGLPKNFFLVGLIQERKKCDVSECVPKPADSEKDEETSIANPCFENSNHEAVFFCEQCDEDFCESCFISLHRPKTFAAHKKTSLTEKPIKLPKCPEHPYNIADLWCKESNCEVVEKRMCHTCLLAGEHKSHEYELLMDRIRSNVEKLKTEIKMSKQHIETSKAKIKRFENCMETYNKKNPSYLELVRRISKEFEAKKVNALKQLEQFSLERHEWFLREININKEIIERFENIVFETANKLKNQKDLHEESNQNLSFGLLLLSSNILWDVLEFNDFHYSLTDGMELNITKKEE